MDYKNARAMPVCNFRLLSPEVKYVKVLQSKVNIKLSKVLGVGL